jgi:hypothetical protein
MVMLMMTRKNRRIISYHHLPHHFHRRSGMAVNGYVKRELDDHNCGPFNR